MASIRIDNAPSSPVRAGAHVVLQAVVDPGEGSAYAWTRNDQPITDATSSEYGFDAVADSIGTFKVSAVVDGTRVTSAPVDVTFADPNAPDQVSTSSASAELPPKFNVLFAVVVGLAAILIAAFLWHTTNLTTNHLGLSDDDWNALEAGQRLAAQLVVPAIVLGAVAVLVGLWMAAVEWRGRFRDDQTAPRVRGASDVGPIIDSIGKLRGAALVMVVGAILMLSAAWVAASAAKPAEPAPAQAPASSPAAPGTTGDTGVAAATGSSG